ncbi:hypothetical protein OQH61_04955 [Helicobacter sp. MIT 21-1697]|uniref:hypothetical protein n=1 Tax=Helicobacter sp. MIT 21-1697 TaxID=2993733 RepID=UPI00224A57F5|nr:hypothetical protein [Helicobacter sp. MIT 21-1697]MCX2717081.1 hypothetical protein [Helicobacter sp. MIT 21-1697]
MQMKMPKDNNQEQDNLQGILEWNRRNNPQDYDNGKFNGSTSTIKTNNTIKTILKLILAFAFFIICFNGMGDYKEAARYTYLEAIIKFVLYSSSFVIIILLWTLLAIHDKLTENALINEKILKTLKEIRDERMAEYKISQRGNTDEKCLT